MRSQCVRIPFAMRSHKSGDSSPALDLAAVPPDVRQFAGNRAATARPCVRVRRTCRGKGAPCPRPCAACRAPRGVRQSAPPLQGHLTRLETGLKPSRRGVPICPQAANKHGVFILTGSGRSDLPRRSRGDLPTATGSETVPTATGETVPRPICRQSPPIVCRRSRAKRATTARRGVPAVRTGSRPSRSAAAPCGVPVRRGDGHGFGQSPRHLRRHCKGI